ncbi:hypothetical protein [Aeromonas hydrophila]|uniref:hypothetical protein n=1 Tax=Aeromonas hydrophila TaxID=644 RepID=UPI0039896045
MEKKYTSLRVSEKRKLQLERAAIEVSYATGRAVKWTEVAFYLFDEYLSSGKGYEGKKDPIEYVVW